LVYTNEPMPITTASNRRKIFQRRFLE